MNIIDNIKTSGIVAVVRADNQNSAIELSKAMVKGGINIIEITFTVPNADKAIYELSKSPDIIVGAGTVMNQETAEAAIKSGAKFIVSPNFNEIILNACLEVGIPYFPGCMTVQEITNAIEAGVEIIKLFPANILGPKYLKTIKSPLPQLQIMPTGGVNIDNMIEWFEAGAIAVGVGGVLTSIGKKQGLDALTEVSSEYIKRIKHYKSK